MIAPLDDAWLTRLIALLASPPETPAAAVRARLVAELAALHAVEPHADSDRFLAWLRSRGQLTAEEHREALLLRESPTVTEVGALLRAEPPPDTLTDGDHALLADLGEGSMGTVRVARDLRLRRRVAYKTVGAHVVADAGRLHRFVTEMQLTAQLDHPNIVPVYAVCVSPEGGLAYSMKLVEGATLEVVIARAAAQPSEAEARALRGRLELFLRVCEAVGYAHDRGVIHRDLKPGNVMVGPRREVYVMDWGVARLYRSPPDDGAGGGSHASGTVDGALIGTPAYMAPEQARGEPRLGPATDQYALGLMLQELVTLRPAIDTSGSFDSVVFRVAGGNRLPLVHAHGAPVAPELVAVVARATRLEPAERYPDVGALADDVRRFLAGDETVALPDSPGRRLARTMVRNPQRVLAVGFVLVLLTVVAVSASVILGLTRDVAAQRAALQATEALTVAEQRARTVESELLRYGRLLEGVSAATTTVLTHTEPQPVAPEFLRAVGTYDAPVSFAGASFRHPDDPRAAREVGQLTRLHEGLERALLRSDPSGVTELSEDDAERVLGEVGVPVHAIDVVLDDGVHLTYPAGVPRQGDGRDTSWYQRSAGARFVQWGPAEPGPRGEPTVTASRSIYGERGDRFLGVAAFQIRVGHVVTRLLGPEVEPGRLVDGSGRVIATSSGPGDLATLADPEVVELLAPGRPAVVERDGQVLAIAPLPTLGWFYIAEVP